MVDTRRLASLFKRRKTEEGNEGPRVEPTPPTVAKPAATPVAREAAPQPAARPAPPIPTARPLRVEGEEEKSIYPVPPTVTPEHVEAEGVRVDTPLGANTLIAQRPWRVDEFQEVGRYYAEGSGTLMATLLLNKRNGYFYVFVNPKLLERAVSVPSRGAEVGDVLGGLVPEPLETPRGVEKVYNTKTSRPFMASTVAERLVRALAKALGLSYLYKSMG